MSVKPTTVTAPKTATIHSPVKFTKSDQATNLGPEAMIQWLYSQMRASNKDVQTTLKQVEGDRSKLNALAKLQQSLRDMKAACGKVEGADDPKASIHAGSIKPEAYKGEITTRTKTGTVDGVDHYEVTTEYGVDKDKLAKEDWYQALSPEGKAAIEKFLGQCNPADGLVMEKQIDAALDKVKDDISALNSNNELQMINLQHVMQTRNQAIQLASNIISVLDRAADVAINNIGKG